jgi:hypothetical protein
VISTIELAGRISPKTSPCARPTSCQSSALRRKIRVRTTCSAAAPTSASASPMISKQRTAWLYASAGGSPPSGITAQVPETNTWRPSRTARQYPIVGS